MMQGHPSELQLQQVRQLKQRQPDEASLHLVQVGRHIQQCDYCQKRLMEVDMLEKKLRVMQATIQPSEGFTDQVMARIQQAPRSDSSASPSFSSPRKLARQEQPAKRRLLVNAAVATAATYLFVASGLETLLFSADSQGLSSHLLDKTVQVIDWIDRFTRTLP